MPQNPIPLLSVIVAVYNGELFLAKFFACLETQAINDIEIIMVNDGSTDGSMAIIESWRSKFPAMKVIEQENQGVSIARNTGLAVATGQYPPSRTSTTISNLACIAACSI